MRRCWRRSTQQRQICGRTQRPRRTRLHDRTAYGRLASRVGALPHRRQDAAQQSQPFQPGSRSRRRRFAAGDMRDAVGPPDQLAALAGDWTETVAGFSDLPMYLIPCRTWCLPRSFRPCSRCASSSQLGSLAAPVNGVVQTLTELITTLTLGSTRWSMVRFAVRHQWCDPAGCRCIAQHRSRLSRSLDDVLRTVLTSYARRSTASRR